MSATDQSRFTGNGFSEPPTPRVGEGLEARRRRLKFRSWHRGTREADLLLGSFADRNLAAFGLAELDAYEALIANSDPDIYAWMTEREPVPPEYDGAVMRLLIAHRFVATDQTPPD